MLPESTFERGLKLSIPWGAITLALSVWAIFAGVSGHNENARANEQRIAATKVEHFYLVVAGRLSGVEPGPANKLARDLRDLNVPEGDDYESAVSRFRGDSNRYGGITRDLGFDPFEGPNCSECGPLDVAVQDTLVVIKGSAAGINEVIEDIEAGIVDDEPLSGPPIWLWALWFFSLPTYLAIDAIMVKRKEEERYREFGTERALLRQVHEIQGALPAGDPRAGGLEQLARRLEAQMNRRVSFAGQKKQDMRLEALAAELEEAVEAIEAGNRELQ